ncbi:MAG: 6-phosphogluconolactonase [Actinomycetota bacterium]
MSLEVFDDGPALAAGAAARIAGWLGDTDPGRVSLGLAGGSTPAAAYLRLRETPTEWGRIDIWLSDERWVPLDHPDSNGRMAAETLCDLVPARFHRPRFAPWLEPRDAAAHYEATLRSIHPDGHEPDLILLGMGDDGHTASLFPGSDALHVERRWFVDNWVEHLDTWRLTATFPLLHRARRLVFLVAGAAKATTLARVFAGEPLPATLAASGGGNVEWLVDRDAASLLGR